MAIRPDLPVHELSDTDFHDTYERLVYSTIHKRYGNAMKQIYHNTGLEREDLEQLGKIGLVKARDKFKPELGYMFSTYAVPMIIGEVQRALRDGNKIKVSRSVHELKQKIVSFGLVDKPALDIAIQLEVSEEEVEFALGYTPSYLHFSSLSVNNHGDGKDVTFEENIHDTFELDTYVANNDVVNNFLNTLDDREREIWYLYNIEELGQVEIGEKVGVSQVQISRLLKAINLKAVEYGKKKGLRK